MENDKFPKIEGDFRKAAARAFREVMKSLKNEPLCIILSSSADDGNGCSLDQITAWLFHKRQDNGSIVLRI